MYVRYLMVFEDTIYYILYIYISYIYIYKTQIKTNTIRYLLYLKFKNVELRKAKNRIVITKTWMRNGKMFKGTKLGASM